MQSRDASRAATESGLETQVAADTERAAERVRVRLGEAQVLHRMRDLTVLDEERPLARHAGDDRPQLVHPARVVEARDEQAALHAADQFFARLVPWLAAGVHRRDRHGRAAPG